MTLRKSLLLASAVLALAGCGGGKSPAAAPDTKRNGGAYDAVDVCTLATDDQLKAALGEGAGGKERRDTDSLKACAVDGSAGNFYLFVTVVRPALPTAQQLAYDKGAVQGAKDIDATTFSYADDDQAYVETADGELVLRVSLVYYVDSGSITDAPALITRLHTLLGQIVQKV